MRISGGRVAEIFVNPTMSVKSIETFLKSSGDVSPFSLRSFTTFSGKIFKRRLFAFWFATFKDLVFFNKPASVI